MARFIVAALVAIGGTALSTLLDRLNVNTWFLAVSWTLPFAAAALIAWWTRWKAAYVAFFRVESKKLSEFEEQVAWDQLPLESVYGKTFEDQPVELDGKHFHRCVFANVKFIYRGQAPFKITNEILMNSWGLYPVPPAMTSLMTFSAQLERQAAQIDTGRVDAHGNLAITDRAIRVPPPVKAKASVTPQPNPEKT